MEDQHDLPLPELLIEERERVLLPAWKTAKHIYDLRHSVAASDYLRRCTAELLNIEIRIRDTNK